MMVVPGKRPEMLDRLPAPKNSGEQAAHDVTKDAWFKGRLDVATAGEKSTSGFKEPPPYGKRQAFHPRSVEDFGDGGAFPEIHISQYPLDMGKQDGKKKHNVLPATLDAQGEVTFDAVVKQGENSRKIVYSHHRDLIPKLPNEIPNSKPSEDEVKETTERTKAALDKIVNERLAAAQPKNVPTISNGSSYIKYTPSQQLSAFNSGAKERTIKMVEMAVDPLEPPKFKHKRVPRPSGSPPVPVMHSPPRAVTAQDQQNWKIPPCISNWKNSKGYTIPLDKRLAADGRGLQEVQINDNFAKLSEALYIAETKARESVEMRAKIQKDIILKEKEKKEQDLRNLAQSARLERAAQVSDMHVEETKEERAARMKRENIRDERDRERKRERRLESKDAHGGKKSKLTRDRDREVSEQVALGLPKVQNVGGADIYDQRLFDQEQGMTSGFGADDSYGVYSTELFHAQPALGGIYRPKKNTDTETYGGVENEEGVKTGRFRPDKGFAGATEPVAPRDKPVEFEKDEEDPFNLNTFLTQVSTKAKEKKGESSRGGTMRASGGSGPRESYEGGSKRSRVDFERGRK